MVTSNPFGTRVSAEYLKYLSHRSEHLEQARHDPNCFAEYCFVDKGGKSIKQGRLHREWQAAMSAHKRAVTIAPRGHGKTVQFCQIRPLFELGNDPNMCIKIISSNDMQAIKRVKALRSHMENNRDLHRVFPVLKRYTKRGGRRKNEDFTDGEWNLGSLTVYGRTNYQLIDPSIQAKSVLSSISGDRADLLIWDDGADRRNSVELPRLRERIVEGVDDYVNTLHPETGRAWAIGTLWSEQDLNHHFMKIWPTYWYEIVVKQAEDGPRFGSYVRHASGYQRRGDSTLWNHWNQERLAERLADIGLRKFMRGFGNRPMMQDEVHIDPDWIAYWKEPPAKDWRIIISVDSASTTGAKSNWTGFVFLAIHPDCQTGRTPPTHRGAIKCFTAYHRKISAPEKVRLVERTFERMMQLGYHVDKIAIENRGGGQELLDFLLEHGEIPSNKLQPVRPKFSKTARIDRISHYIENGTCEFNPTMDPGLGGNLIKDDDGNVVSELVAIPLGEYDDLADAYSQGVWVAIHTYPGLKALGSFGEEDLDDDPREERTGTTRLWVI